MRSRTHSPQAPFASLIFLIFLLTLEQEKSIVRQVGKSWVAVRNPIVGKHELAFSRPVPGSAFFLMIYIDESGDWGFAGGSSKFTTIAGLVVDNPKPIKNYTRRFKKKAGLRKGDELHASSMKFRQKRAFLCGLMKHPFSVIGITLKKENVKDHLRGKPNILFNYQAGLLLIPIVSELKEESVIFDRRSQKVVSGNSLFDYLTLEINAALGKNTILTLVWGDSHLYLGLQAADIIANAIWRKHERGDTALFDIFRKRIVCDRELFF